MAFIFTEQSPGALVYELQPYGADDDRGFGGVPFFQSALAEEYRRRKQIDEARKREGEKKPTLPRKVENAIARVAKRVDYRESAAKAERALVAELKRLNVAYEQFHAKQLEEARNAAMIQELQMLIQKDLEQQERKRQFEEEAILLLMLM